MVCGFLEKGCQTTSKTDTHLWSFWCHAVQSAFQLADFERSYITGNFLERANTCTRCCV